MQSPRYLLLLALALLAGCMSQSTSEPSHALPPGLSPLGERVQELASRQAPGTSGFRLLPSSTEAFSARAELIRAARTSLDIQYYIVHDGLTTRALVHELLQAADRGVRIRILLDDTTSDGNDYRIAKLAAHPNIHLRVFNPLHLGRSTGITRAAGRLLNLSLQHRRMHNKLMLADSSLAIVGGRNLGDEYFDADQVLNFTDIDLLGVGPVAGQLASSFDQYWNHALSAPIQQFLRKPPDDRDLRRAQRQLRRALDEAVHTQPTRYRRLMAYQSDPQLPGWLAGLTWAPATAMWDDPDKISANGLPDPELLLTTQLQPAMQQVSEELTLVSAYFVPTRTGVDYLSERAAAGVNIRLLTNALEATDVPAVHGGYAPYRKALLRNGVQLFELRRQPEEKVSYSLSGDSESSLHSKAAVLDQKQVFIGSFNLDPRSVLWNTEVGILVDSPELAREVHQLLLEGMAPAISYEVRLRERDGSLQLVWIAENQGQLEILEKEPGNLWRRFNAWVANAIGLERML